MLEGPVKEVRMEQHPIGQRPQGLAKALNGSSAPFRFTYISREYSGGADSA